LHGFNNQESSLQEALIWASLVSLMLKRFTTGCVEQLFKIEMSTMVVSKTSLSWWHDIFEAIIQQRRKALVNRIAVACNFLKENAKRSHSERDRYSGILQYALEPEFYAKIQ